MRRVFRISLLCLLAIPVQAGIRPSHKVVVAVLAQNSDRSAKLESRLLDKFADRSIYAASLHVLFQSSMTPSDMINQMRAQGYDTLLCIAPRPTIHWGASKASVDLSSLRSCLTTYSSGTYPTGDMIEAEPMQLSAANNGGPIPGNVSVSSVQIMKGSIGVMNVSDGAQLWYGRVQSKFPNDAREDIKLDLVAREIWKVLTKANLFPKS